LVSKGKFSGHTNPTFLSTYLPYYFFKYRFKKNEKEKEHGAGHNVRLKTQKNKEIRIETAKDDVYKGN